MTRPPFALDISAPFHYTVEGVLLTQGTVDATNPKGVRAGMGAHFRLPMVPMDWDEIAHTVVRCRVYLADAQGSVPYTDADRTGRVALILGREAAGAGSRAHAPAKATIAIPMAAGVESLNAALAAAVLLSEAARQRRYSPRRTQNTECET